MKTKLLLLFFLIPVLFSGNSPMPEPPAKPVIAKLEEINNKMIDLTKFLENEKVR